MNVSIRQATLDDLAVLAAQRRAMFFDMGTKDTGMLDQIEREFKSWVKEHLTSGTYYAWVAESVAQSVIIGGAGLWLMDWPPNIVSPAKWRGNIFNVYTDPAFRRQGIARRLTSVVLKWCQERSINCVILHASQQGRPLYDSLGFESTNEMRILLKSQSPGSNS